MEDLAVFTAISHSGSFGKNFVKGVDKRMVKIFCKNFLVHLCCSILRRTQSPAKFTC